MNIAAQQMKCAQDRIVDAARMLFATRGFRQTAMADLAREAQVSVGAIYRVFKGKDEIIRAIMDSHHAERLADMQAILREVREKRLPVECALTQLAIYELSKDEEALGYEVMAEAHRDPHICDAIASVCGGYREVCRELACLINPRLEGVLLQGAEELMLACMFGLSHRNLARPTLDDETTARITARLVVNALQSVDQISPCISGKTLEQQRR